ncbi:caspase family protein [Streptomyces sp. WM6372]|uniref:caspase family protein n=1 Tax=Streptomyces sp. WM6372 TaxID=1415555 RepID=UPI0006AFC266|nr:caspase family protein [Streptomyces sp. WM6372]
MAELTVPDPARVHAVVVGIEHFPRISGKDLPGAAADAMRLARWLRTRGVPAGNIRLLLAPMAGSWQDLNAEARELGLDIEPVTSRDQIIDKLAPARTVPEGDVLYVYWGGHGVLDRGDRRLLLCPDASDAEPRCLDLMDLREYLTRPDVARCRRQVFLVDACATFVQDNQTRPVVAALPAGKRVPVEQFMLLAAASGQAATQRTAERTGAFSTAVMDWLEEHSPGLSTDLDALVAHTKEHFTGYRLGSRQLQTPVTLVIQPFGGDVEIRQGPAAPATEPAGPPAGPERSGGVRRAAAVWAGAAALVVIAVVAAVALNGGPDGGGQRGQAAPGGSAPAQPSASPSPSAPSSGSASPSPSPSASSAAPSTAAPSGAPTPQAQAAGAAATGGKESCAAFHTADDPKVSESPCFVREGTTVFMRAYVRATVPTKVTVYVWLTLKDGNKYLYPDGGAKTWTLTAGPDPQVWTERVATSLASGTEYEVHVSTKVDGATPPKVTNPAVTGHGQWFRY